MTSISSADCFTDISLWLHLSVFLMQNVPGSHRTPDAADLIVRVPSTVNDGRKLTHPHRFNENNGFIVVMCCLLFTQILIKVIYCCLRMWRMRCCNNTNYRSTVREEMLLAQPTFMHESRYPPSHRTHCTEEGFQTKTPG